MKPLDVVLTFFTHVLSVFGSVALAHYFFPGNPVWMFLIVLLGVLLIDWHKNPNPENSVIGLIIMTFNRTKQVVRPSRPKTIDTLPPEEHKNA